MKTIEQKRFSKIEIREDHAGHFLEQNHYHIRVEKDSDAIPDLIQALLPPGKALIDVPKGYEVSEVCRDGDAKGYKKITLFLKQTKKQDFHWPEHLPDGITEIRKVSKTWLIGAKPCYHMTPLDIYNSLARPEDRITIPDWLEKEPRTLVKGEK